MEHFLLVFKCETLLEINYFSLYTIRYFCIDTPKYTAIAMRIPSRSSHFHLVEHFNDPLSLVKCINFVLINTFTPKNYV